VNTRASEVRIYFVWPARDDSERHVGFGAHPLLVKAVGVISMTTVIVAGLALPMGFPAAALTVYGALAALLLIGALVRWGSSYRYYELDDQYRPMHSIGLSPPSTIQGRLPVRASRAGR
jgi:hypothetical protein